MFDFLKSGKLEKLKIEGFTNITRSGLPVATFEAFINPEEVSINYVVISDTEGKAGGTSSPGQFVRSLPLQLTLKFFIDGTNTSGTPLKLVTGVPATVAEKIREFYQAVGYSGNSHQTHYVRILWGNLALLRFDPDVFNGKLKNAQIQYKLFKPDGTPLRAIITATFIEAIAPEEAESIEQNSSPDLTHMRMVKEGDTLPGLTLSIYGDFSYYPEVARINGLDDFRNLTPGTRLIFPPLEMASGKGG
jgi:hypothetical protein